MASELYHIAIYYITLYLRKKVIHGYFDVYEPEINQAVPYWS